MTSEWKELSPQEVYDLIRKGAADGGWQSFAQWVSKALKEKNFSVVNNQKG